MKRCWDPFDYYAMWVIIGLVLCGAALWFCYAIEGWVSS